MYKLIKLCYTEISFEAEQQRKNSRLIRMQKLLELSHKLWLFFIAKLKEKRGSLLTTVCVNPFVPNVPFLYPLKTLENRKGRERVYWEQMEQNKLTFMFPYLD